MARVTGEGWGHYSARASGITRPHALGLGQWSQVQGFGPQGVDTTQQHTCSPSSLQIHGPSPARLGSEQIAYPGSPVSPEYVGSFLTSKYMHCWLWWQAPISPTIQKDEAEELQVGRPTWAAHQDCVK